MANPEDDRRDMSRRAALHVAVAGGATAVVGSQFTPALAVIPSSALPPVTAKPLRRDRVKVAAVQMEVPPSTDSCSEAVVAEMVQAITSVHDQTGSLDLVSFHSCTLPTLDIHGSELVALITCAQEFDCYLTCGTQDLHNVSNSSELATSVLIEPSGDVRLAHDSGPQQFATEVGTLALVQGSLSPDTVKKLAAEGAEILIRSVPAGYPIWDMQAGSAYTQVYSVVVTEALAYTDPSTAATAIIDCDGKIMTRTGSCWNQTVIATLPIARIRTNRAS